MSMPPFFRLLPHLPILLSRQREMIHSVNRGNPPTGTLRLEMARQAGRWRGAPAKRIASSPRPLPQVLRPPTRRVPACRGVLRGGGLKPVEARRRARALGPSNRAILFGMPEATALTVASKGSGNVPDSLLRVPRLQQEDLLPPLLCRAMEPGGKLRSHRSLLSRETPLLRKILPSRRSRLSRKRRRIDAKLRLTAANLLLPAQLGGRMSTPARAPFPRRRPTLRRALVFLAKSSRLRVHSPRRRVRAALEIIRRRPLRPRRRRALTSRRKDTILELNPVFLGMAILVLRLRHPSRARINRCRSKRGLGSLRPGLNFRITRRLVRRCRARRCPVRGSISRRAKASTSQPMGQRRISERDSLSDSTNRRGSLSSPAGRAWQL